MKIEEVKVYYVKASNDSWVWLRMTTDEGFEGWGEITGSSNDEATAQIVEKIAKEIYGQNPLHVLSHLSTYIKASYPFNGVNRYFSTAWSGIDQCLWDIKAQSFGLPLNWLLGGYGKNEIALYANLNRGLLHDRSPDALLENGKQAIENGFSIIKCTPFDEVTPAASVQSMEKGIKRLEKLASQVPLSKVAIDCHHRFHRVHLNHLTKELEQLGMPYWIEDPVPVAQLETQQMIAQSFPAIRWAGGETSYTISEIISLLQSRAFDIVMPDVKHCGGVSALKTIIPLIEASGAKVSLHNPSGPIATAFSAHLLALAASPEPLEFPWGAAMERREAVLPFENIQKGSYQLNEKPGIGIRPSQEFLDEFSLVWSKGCWIRTNQTIVKG
ncbi:mandelate racemase/muconate lactonizing enzyme family protein [Alkalihalobacillus oceani]|uniref:Mandelate racemase/muconate lactonizing enzyme family protein n=1 Tax=Halalkalibacter oceani TaxID=1653776 RepID=A0A9X2DRJ1_9BACI|nr:mandelate racemase/muconate lactonizing enzyme family protein [Halalkalibacter oceani]MCM3715649.1 mandelate racemase/muconate lactonizing enzyme family protein [Halalkalibacter oceani]